jgi:hypothetical protein
MSRAASLLMRVLFPTPVVSDYTCGYRAYRAEAVPLILRYDLKRGPSRMRLMKTSAHTLRLLWRRKMGTRKV